MMKFESLANELLLNLFDYFNPIHLFSAFHGLNSRFDRLLFDHYRVYHVDFQSVSKHDFDIFCQRHLPSIVNRIVSLRLSDDEETPDLSNDFLRHRFTLNKFTHLKSLILHDLPFETLNELVSDFHHLSNVTHLKITIATTSLVEERNLPYNLMNNIWCLPSLTHCHLGIMIFPETLQVTSSSIKYLFIKYLPIMPSNLANIFKHTTHLRHLFTTNFNVSDSIAMVPSITTLNISTDCSLRLLHRLFQIMPNLSHVTLEMTKSDITFLDGQQWKQLIVNYLPNIKKFRFIVSAFFDDEINIENKVNEILNTFRTPFWLDEHRWFVRCEWDPENKTSYIRLYTLPHCFGDCYILNPAYKFKSTWPQDRNYRPYDRSHNRMDYISSEKCFIDWPLSLDLFPKIDHLTINLPIYENIWSIIPIFDHLTSLEVSLHNRTYLSQLQVLLNRVPRLYSLSVDRLLAPQLTQLNLVHARIRQLIVSEYCFNGPECSLLASSSLGRQCEILSIKLTDRRHIPELINEMPNLRALTCNCEDNKWDIDESLLSSEKNIIKWLEDNLPSTCSISQSSRWQVQVWIDR